nr:DNA recombination protein RmuC [Arenimonas sp.]
MELLLYILIALALVGIVLQLLGGRRDPAARLVAELESRISLLRADLERVERGVRDEQRAGRNESQASLVGFDARLVQFTERTEGGLGSLRQNLGDDARRSREESALSLQRFNEALQARLEKLNESTDRRMADVRQTLEERLKSIQDDNAAKLELMRQTVDEKLQATLETRLGESFRLVSERLEQVHLGLGEMRNLATGVGDLKRVLGNVKTRGIFGEVALAGILEQMMTADQYATNVATVPGSNDRVEFAIRLPGSSDQPDIPMWLPIDAKFPREDYERLLDAQERADAESAALA